MLDFVFFRALISHYCGCHDLCVCTENTVEFNNLISTKFGRSAGEELLGSTTT